MYTSILFQSDPEIMAEIGGRLRALRKSRRLSRTEAAQQAGLNLSTVARAEKGSNPTLLTLLRLLRVYGDLHSVETFVSEAEVSPLAAVASKRRGSRG
jgi:transcriptional regulator with XRE-family HTH domain